MKFSERTVPMDRRIQTVKGNGDTGSREGSMDFRIYRVIEFLKAHFGEELTEQSLADGIGMTREHFGRLFRAETGYSPMTFLRDLRFEAARSMLEAESYPDFSVKQVAMNVGIHDMSHFVREFEKRFGYSPRQYKNEKARIRSLGITSSQ